MIFEPDIRVPRECPLCGFVFLRDDGHDQRPLSDMEKATESFWTHDALSHGGLLVRLVSWFG